MTRIARISPAYRPEPGTAPAKAVEHFDANPGQELPSAELAAMLGIEKKNVSGALANAVKYGLLKIERRGRSCFYSQGNGEPLPAGEPQEASEPPAQEAAALNITIALYNDGDMTITGGSEIEGGILLTRAQASELREYLLHTGSLLEHLQAVQS